jgi:hypothetical protein
MELRHRLGLFDQIPRVEHAHLPQIVAMDPEDRTVLVCVHDEANERAHQIWFPAPAGPGSIIDPDSATSGQLKPEVIEHCGLYLAAAYN